METNRIDSLFDLATKNATAKYMDKDAAVKSGGFADLLFGVMSHRAADLAVDRAQVRAAATTTTASLRNGRGLPSTRFDTSHGDDRTTPLPLHDRRIERDGTALAKNDAVAKTTGQVQDDHGGNPVRADRKHDNVGKSGCGDQQVSDVTGGEPLDTGNQVDATTKADLADDSQDASLGTEGDDTETDAGQGDGSDQTTDQQAGLVLVTCAVPVDDTIVTAEIGTQIVPQATPATTGDTTAPTADIGQAPALAALTDMGDIGGDDQIATPESNLDIGTREEEMTEATKPAVTFAATVSLGMASDLDTADVEAQKLAGTADNERQLEDPGNLFRRNGNNGRKTAPVGSGATAGMHPGTQNTAQATPDLHAAVAQNNAGTTGGSAAPVAGVAPIGFDTSLGTPTGLAGWNLHLAQGGAVRRGDFVANLRQHLQNLPVHDQVALTIQRSVRDGGGSITLQLSPTELGRIHVKLDIDKENNVQASVMVERPATLDLLQRDMKALERALQDAGLKAGPGDLSFSLQGGDAEAFARDFSSGNGTGSGGNGRASEDGIDDLPASTAAAVIATGDGWVDVQV